MCVCVWWAGRGEVIQKAPGGTLETYKHVDQASWVVLAVTSPPANAGDIRDTGLIPGSGRAVGGGHSNPLQYSCLKNPHGQRSLEGYSPQGRNRTQLKRLSTHTAHTHRSHWWGWDAVCWGHSFKVSPHQNRAMIWSPEASPSGLPGTGVPPTMEEHLPNSQEVTLN